MRDGKIIFTGSEAEVARLIGPKTQVEDAGGKLVLPGLIDAHIHPMGIVDFGGCDLESKARTLAEIAEFVRTCIEHMRVPPGPVGCGVGLGVWRREPSRSCTSDPARSARCGISTNPIVMTGWDGHHGAYNSAALALAKNAKGEVVGYSKKTLTTDLVQYKTYVGVDAEASRRGILPIRESSH